MTRLNTTAPWQGKGLSPVWSKPDMVSTPLSPFLLALPGTTFSDRVYYRGEKYSSNGEGKFVKLEVCLLCSLKVRGGGGSRGEVEESRREWGEVEESGRSEGRWRKVEGVEGRWREWGEVGKSGGSRGGGEKWREWGEVEERGGSRGGGEKWRERRVTTSGKSCIVVVLATVEQLLRWWK